MTDPDDALNALVSCPVLLLPVRVETRFPPGLRELRVRICPDQAHVDAHRPGLTDQEVATGRAYWRARWDGHGDAAWLDLTRGLRPSRARWVVRATTPTNLDHIGDPNGPDFGDPPRAEAGLGAIAGLAALPAEWLVVGYQGDAEVVRVRTAPVAAELVVGLLDADSPTPVDGDRPFGPQAAWAVDYELAVQAGMAVTIPADVVGGAGFDAGLDRLLVLGIATGGTPESGSAALDDLLAAHAYSDGLCLLASGLATNDTGDGPPTPSRPVVVDPASAPPAAAARLRADLGLASGGAVDDVPLVGPNGSAPDPTAAELAAGGMVDALWSATLGYVFHQMLQPAVSPADNRDARAHAREHLRPSGRYPILQVGGQPYGLLPVVASAHLRGTTVSDRLVGLLRKLLPVWTTAAARIPRLAPGVAEGGDVDSTLFGLLRRAPSSTRYRFRTVLGPMLAANTAGLTGAGALQAELRDLVFTDVLGATQRPRLAQFVAHPGQQPLRVPPVGPGTDQLEPNYLRDIAGLLREPDARPALAQRQPGSLLEALIALAAVHEIDSAVAVLAARHAPVDSPLRRATWLTPELPGITSAAAPSPRLLAEFAPPDLGQPLRTAVSELLARAEADPGLPDADRVVVEGLLALLHAVEAMAALDPATLEAALSAFLDACSHRLDAWFTSLAAAQLATVRAARPTGVHVGGFGWVEAVHPDERSAAAGYLLGPSLAHASAAAVLRSGYQTHLDEGSDAFDVDLTSRRAEQALELVREVGAGVRLGQVLGYHFERGLHDRGLERLVQLMRTIAPLHPGPPRLASEVTPLPPNPDTVDGQALLDRRVRVSTALVGQPADVINGVEAELDLLAERLDAVGDLATAESVYQLVLGRPERVRSALALLDRQDQAPEPEITTTPLAGSGFVHRVLVVLTETAPAAGWSGIARDIRATALPRIDAWVGRLLGSPDRWQFTGRAVDSAGAELARATVRLSDLGLSALGATLATDPATGSRPTEMEERVARALAARLGPQPPGTAVELLADTVGRLGLGTFLAHAGAIRAVLAQCRSADAGSFAPPDAVVADGLRLGELTQRADAAASAYAAAHEQLTTILADPAPGRDAVRDALDGATASGVAGAMPPLELLDAGSGSATQPAGGALLALARSVETAMGGVLRQLAALGEPSADAASELARQRRRLELLVGAAVPAAPVFDLDDAAGSALRAAASAQPALTAGDPLAPVTWITRTSRVRQPVGTLWRALIGAEATTGGFASEQLVVAQRPHRDGEPWAALEFGPTGPPLVDVALVLVAPGGPQALASATDPGGSGIAALVVDAWSEHVPAADQSAGLAFQYDAPDGRAPQAWLLAVPPDPDAATWTAEQLVDTVREAADLTAARAVTLADIPAAAPVLPALYVPFTLGNEVAGIDFRQWVPTVPMVLGRD